MEEQKKQITEVQQGDTDKQNAPKGNATARSSILWIFAGGYLIYTGCRLCKSVLAGADGAGKGFLAAGGIFVVIGAVLLVMAIRSLARAGAEKASEQEAAAGKMTEETAGKKMSISERAHLAENLDDAGENERETAGEETL